MPKQNDAHTMVIEAKVALEVLLGYVEGFYHDEDWDEHGSPIDEDAPVLVARETHQLLENYLQTFNQEYEQRQKERDRRLP